MAKKEAKERIEKLKALINHHRYLYHVLDRQEISEAALDSLKKELFDLEQQFPEMVTQDSPTQRVGGNPLEKFEKVKHPFPMLSFNDAFSEKDMEDWLGRISRILTKEEASRIDFYCELKIDGLAIELIYENAILKTGSTRGDGQIGENVTNNLKTIEAIPLKLREKEKLVKDLEKEAREEITAGINKKDALERVVARGEVFISKKEFERINKEQEKNKLPLFANPRNVAAGSIRQLDPKVTAGRGLDSFAYELMTDFGQRTHEEKHKILKALGFKTNSHNKYCRNLKEVFEFHQYWQKSREKIPYEIDGVVVVVNDNKIFEKLGVVGKAPRGTIAFKFPLKQATTIIEDIKVHVGRTGALTPIAVLRPVQVGGVTISRATLHNEDEIERLGVKIGDTVIVGRAGDVIPDVIRSLPELRTGKEKEFSFPQKCPDCGQKVAKIPGEVVLRCLNENCPAKRREGFYHFISKGAFDIVGLGPKIIDKLIDANLIQDPADLFTLEIGDILPLESLPRRKPKAFLRGFAEKSAKKIIEAIQSKKKINMARFIFALGIRNAGEKTSKDLSDYFGSLENLAKADIDSLQKIMDIGPVVGQSVYQWFQNKNNLEFLRKLKESGVEIVYQKKSGHQPLKDKKFVLTGTLENLSREKAKEKINLLGGEISGSVSKETDYVIAGREPGSKYEKAKKLGLKIIDEKQFLSMLKE